MENASARSELPRRPLSDYRPIGGHPVLDFINTGHARYTGGASDFLHSMDDVLTWIAHADLVPAAAIRQARAVCRAEPQRGKAVFDYALELRRVLYRIFHAAADSETPPPEEVRMLDESMALLGAFRRLRLFRREARWEWTFDPVEPRSILGPLAMSAAELLTSANRDRIKECPSPDGCGWLFLDLSRNRSRHWCSMKDCGNLAKVRRHRRRRR
jgi:predicted RNA-binding Zn ribbon-like protein